MIKIFVGVLITVIVVFAGIKVFSSSNNAQQSETLTDQGQTNLTDEIKNDNNSNPILLIGAMDAPVIIIKYFDYKCPNCNFFHRGVGREIQTNYVDTGTAKVDMRFTPIVGPDSATAARGAYCANEQNVFEEYHHAVLDYMFDNYYEDRNFSVELDNILTSAKLAELSSPFIEDTDTFVRCTNSSKYNAQLDNNLNLAADNGVRGTPAFTVGSQSFVGNQPFSVFKTLLDIETNR